MRACFSFWRECGRARYSDLYIIFRESIFSWCAYLYSFGLRFITEGFCNEAKWQTVLFVIEGRRPEITNNSLIAEGEARAIIAKVCQFAELQKWILQRPNITASVLMYTHMHARICFPTNNYKQFISNRLLFMEQDRTSKMFFIKKKP